MRTSVIIWGEVALRWALASIYYSTRGEDWTSAKGWLPSASIREWEHIDCDPMTGSLQEIALAGNNLVGTIPSEFALMGDTIQSIWLRASQLTGTTHPRRRPWIASKTLHSLLE